MKRTCFLETEECTEKLLELIKQLNTIDIMWEFPVWLTRLHSSVENETNDL